MKRILATLALTSWLAAPAFAAGSLDPHCADFMGMDADGRMKAMQAMHDEAGGMMGDTGGASGMMMEPGEMMSRGGEACEAHPGGTVGEAMRRMGPG